MVGDANRFTRSGNSSGQCDVHGVADGLPLYCLLSRIAFSSSSDHFLKFFFKSVLSEKAPFLIIGIIAILGSCPGLFLPETADVNLPDSLEEMKDFGK